MSNFPENPYEQIEACVPYATHAHVRDFYGEPKKPLDLDRVWSIFAKAGYKEFMSAEYESDEDPMTGVPKLVGQIKDLCRKLQRLGYAASGAARCTVRPRPRNFCMVVSRAVPTPT